MFPFFKEKFPECISIFFFTFKTKIGNVILVTNRFLVFDHSMSCENRFSALPIMHTKIDQWKTHLHVYFTITQHYYFEFSENHLVWKLLREIAI